MPFIVKSRHANHILSHFLVNDHVILHVKIQCHIVLKGSLTGWNQCDTQRLDTNLYIYNSTSIEDLKEGKKTYSLH